MLTHETDDTQLYTLEIDGMEARSVFMTRRDQEILADSARSQSIADKLAALALLARSIETRGQGG